MISGNAIWTILYNISFLHFKNLRFLQCITFIIEYKFWVNALSTGWNSYLIFRLSVTTRIQMDIISFWSHCLLSQWVQKERTIKSNKTNYIYHHQSKRYLDFLYFKRILFEKILNKRWYAFLHFVISKRYFHVKTRKMIAAWKFILTAKWENKRPPVLFTKLQKLSKWQMLIPVSCVCMLQL